MAMKGFEYYEGERTYDGGTYNASPANPAKRADIERRIATFLTSHEF
ncbi:MAG: hypothetical protein Q4A79_02330 [Candidatus Saccharibacteria bacterium]|nr:hypothetical protein [Candidatus Saccharibacteria bacterium]